MSKINSLYSMIPKQSRAVAVPPCVGLFSKRLENFKIISMGGVTAGFNRCIKNIQGDIQTNLCTFQQELHKGKVSSQAHKAMDDLTAFNKNISFCMIKSFHHLAHFTLMYRDPSWTI